MKIPHIFKKIRLFYNTTKNCSIKQIAYYFAYRIAPSTYKQPAIIEKPNIQFRLTKFYFHNSQINGEKFIFLNQESKFTSDKIDWESSLMPKLWRYHLHYFDYLQSDIDNAKKVRLIDNWIEENPYPKEDAWEPYTTSLRIINWIKYITAENIQASDSWIRSLYLQGHYLSHHIEWHISANHLLKNLVALVIWSHYFSGPYAVAWRKKSIGLLQAALSEQFLSDGGHYERSPTYHNICVGFLEDAYNCLSNNSTAGLDWLEYHISKSLIFSQILALPNNTYPLLKDSVNELSYTTTSLAEYARLLGIKNNHPLREDIHSYSLDESGYFVFRKGTDFILFDHGDIKSKRQPGHAHCDALHIEVYYDGRPLFTDTGVFCYEASQERTFSRSVLAHNTARINRLEQHEIWGAFRIARRGKIIRATSSATSCSAEFMPYHANLWNPVKHRRSLVIDEERTISITDEFYGRKITSVDIFWHLAPGLTPLISNNQIEISDEFGNIFAVIKSQYTDAIPSITKTDFYPEFGVCLSRYCITYSYSPLQQTLKTSFTISKLC